MRQLAIYLTRVQPAKLNITWGLCPSSLLLVRVGSRSFLESRNTRDFALPRSFALCEMILYMLVHPWMSNAESSAPLILPVTFCAFRSVIADSSTPRYIVANCWPLLPDFTRHYDRPSTFGIDRPAVDQREKKMYWTHNDHLKKYHFVIFFFFCSSKSSSFFVFWKPSVNKVTSGIQTKWHSCANIKVDKLRLKNNRSYLKRIDNKQ